MKERDVEVYCTKKVHQLGGICAKHVSPGRAGDPDRLLKLPGFPAGLLELKRPGEHPRPLQFTRIEQWARAGMVAGWASTPAEVDAFIERLQGQCRDDTVPGGKIFAGSLP